MNSIDSILKEALTASGNHNTKKRKSNKEDKPVVTDSEEVEIVEDTVSSKHTFDSIYDTIKSKKTTKIRENIAEWTQRDFALYILKKYAEKYNTPATYSSTGIVVYFGRIKESVREYLGISTNYVVKSYVDFFFDNWLDFYLNTNPKYWLMCMRNREPLADFSEKCDSDIVPIRNSAPEVVSVRLERKEELEPKETLTSNIEKEFLLGIELLLVRYDISLIISYLINKKSYSKEMAVDKIAETLISVYNTKVEEKINKMANSIKKNKKINMEDINSIMKEKMGEKMYQRFFGNV